MEEQKAYVKCNYSKGMFSSEYFVEFKGSFYPGNLGGVFVMKENVKCKNETSGLVKAIIAQKNEKTSQVLIPAMTDDGHFFTVPNEEIIFE
jgi:hypothetical protein